MPLSQETLLQIATEAAVMNRNDNARLRAENERLRGSLRTVAMQLREAAEMLAQYDEIGQAHCESWARDAESAAKPSVQE